MARLGVYHKLWLLFFVALGLSVAAIGISLAFAQTPAGISAIGGTMTLRDVLRYTYDNNPSLQSARSDFRATQELLPQAQAGWKPTVDSSANITKSDLTGSNFPGAAGSTSKEVGVSLDQPVFRGGRTFAASSAARDTIQSQAEILRSIEQDVLLRVVTTYMDVLRDQALMDLAVNNREVIARQLEASEIRFEVGELSITDVSQAKARLARADSEIIAARGNLDTSEALFEEIVGMRPVLLSDPALDPALPQMLDEAVSVAEQNNPRILAATYAHEAAEDDVDNVFGELLPEIGFFASWNRAFDPQPGIVDRQTTKSVGLSASFPLYQGGAVRSRVRQAKHSANSRYMDILDVKRQVRQEVVSAWASWNAARSDINSRVAQIEASAIASEGVSAEAELGARTVLDTLDADQELLDAKVALVTSRRDEVVAKFTLLTALGLLSPQSLEFETQPAVKQPETDKPAPDSYNMDVDRLPPKG
ncbi:MAG: TolC family outer membrane protein [Alphaproteobacteria bacterium]|nr:TolC family outer membrane protein [Alphaproteobacteria bacterium]